MGAKAKHIMVVDDDEDILEALRFMLEDAGFKVTSSPDWESAEDLVNSKSLPDLLLLDVLLSGRDGRDVVKKLRSQDSTSKLPIIMISAHPGASAHFLEYGASGFVAKPFSVEHILKEINKLIE